MEDPRKLVKKQKLMIKILKYLPALMAALYLVNTILGYFNIDMTIISLISGVSLLPLIFLYVASYALGFCSYHRMFLHYIAVSDSVLWAITFLEITLSTYTIFLIMMLIAGVSMFIILYLWLKKK